MEKLKSRIKNGYKHFSIGTFMHGYAELYMSQSTFFIIVWIIIIVISLGMTMFHIYSALKQYIDQPTTVVIQPLSADKEILYPPLQLCYQHWMYWVDIEKARELNFTDWSVLFGLSYIYEIYSDTNIEITESREEFFAAMKENKFETLNMFYKQISLDTPLHTENDMVFTEKKLKYKDGQPLFCFTAPEGYVKSYFKPVTLNDYLLQFDVLVSQRSYWINQITHNCNMARNYYLYSPGYLNENYNNLDIYLPDLPLLLFIDKYNGLKVDLISDYTEINIYVKSTVTEKKPSPQAPCVTGSASLLSDEGCNYKCESEYRVERCVCPHEELFHLGLDYPENLCQFKIFSSVTPQICLNLTQANFGIIDRIRQNSSRSNTFCKSVDHVEGCCTNDFSHDSKYEKCMSGCAKNISCEIWTHEMSMIPFAVDSTYRNISNRITMDVRIFYQSAEKIIYMKQIDLQSWENLVGNVGGLLGIWTGASIISIFQLVYLCFCSESTLGSRNNIQSLIDNKVRAVAKK